MRELSFSQLWPKLAKPRCTTFRFTRKDKDWQVGETVKMLYKARSHKDRSVLGLAVIIKKQPIFVCHVAPQALAGFSNEQCVSWVSRAEASVDGFNDSEDMIDYMFKRYGYRTLAEPMNKLTLAWTQYWIYAPEQKLHIQKDWAYLLTKGELTKHVHGDGWQWIVHQAELERIHNQAALGSLA